MYAILAKHLWLQSERAVDCLLVRRLTESLQKTVAIGLKITAETFGFFRVEEILMLARDGFVPTAKDVCDKLLKFGVQKDFDPLELPRMDDVGFNFFSFKHSVKWAVMTSSMWHRRVSAQFHPLQFDGEALEVSLSRLKPCIAICHGLHRQRATDALELAKHFTKNPDLQRDILQMHEVFIALDSLGPVSGDEDAHAMIASFIVHETIAMKLEKALELIENEETRKLCARAPDDSDVARVYTTAAAHGLFAAPHALRVVGERIEAHGPVPIELSGMVGTLNKLGSILFQDRRSSHREVQTDLKWNKGGIIEEKDAVQAFDDLDNMQKGSLVRQIALRTAVSGDPFNYSYETDGLAPTFARAGFFAKHKMTDTDRYQTTRSATPAARFQTTYSFRGGVSQAGPSHTRSQAGPSQTHSQAGPSQTRSQAGPTSLSLRERISPASGSSVSSVHQGERSYGGGRGEATAINRTPPVEPRADRLRRIPPVHIENFYVHGHVPKRASETDEGRGSRKRTKKEF